jgi:signal recognition particle GTPase
MVLADLGSKVAVALRKMTQAPIVDANVLNEMLTEICKALLQADVNVAQVKHLRESIKKNVDIESLASGMNKRKMLEQARVRLRHDRGARPPVCARSVQRRRFPRGHAPADRPLPLPA